MTATAGPLSRARRPTLAFLVCVEKGGLEARGRRLCRSIRRWGGKYRDAPIYTFQARAGAGIGADTLAELAALGVVHDARALNTVPQYGPGNKVFVCAWAEEALGEDFLVFTDTDTLLVGEPADLDLPAGVDCAIRPADSVPMNSTGPGDPFDGYWRRVYRATGVTAEPYVETELGRRVRAYFSSGLVAVRREAGLFRQWRDDFLLLVRGGLMPESSGIDRMDEVSLAATLARAFSRVRLLDGRYNYLLYRREMLPPPWDRVELEDLVHIHYRFALDEPGYLEEIEPPLDPRSEILQWMAASR